jgi:hypothetical protein
MGEQYDTKKTTASVDFVTTGSAPFPGVGSSASIAKDTRVAEVSVIVLWAAVSAWAGCGGLDGVASAPVDLLDGRLVMTLPAGFEAGVWPAAAGIGLDPRTHGVLVWRGEGTIAAITAEERLVRADLAGERRFEAIPGRVGSVAAALPVTARVVDGARLPDTDDVVPVVARVQMPEGTWTELTFRVGAAEDAGACADAALAALGTLRAGDRGLDLDSGSLEVKVPGGRLRLRRPADVGVEISEVAGGALVDMAPVDGIQGSRLVIYVGPSPQSSAGGRELARAPWFGRPGPWTVIEGCAAPDRSCVVEGRISLGEGVTAHAVVRGRRAADLDLWFGVLRSARLRVDRSSARSGR